MESWNVSGSGICHLHAWLIQMNFLFPYLQNEEDTVKIIWRRVRWKDAGSLNGHVECLSLIANIYVELCVNVEVLYIKLLGFKGLLAQIASYTLMKLSTHRLNFMASVSSSPKEGYSPSL